MRVAGADSPVDGDSISRNTRFAFAIQLTTAAFTAVLTLYLVRKLGAREFGVFSLALSVMMLMLLPADFGVSQSTARFAAERRGDVTALASLIRNATRLKLALTGVVCLAMFLAAGLIADAYDEPALGWVLRGLAVALFGQSLVAFYSVLFSSLARTSLGYAMILGESSAETVASIALVAGGAGAAGAAFGRAIGYGVGAVMGALILARLVPRRRARGPAREVSRRRLAGYAGALLVVDSAYTLFQQIDVLLIGGILGTAAAGVFQAPLRLIVFLHYPGLALAAGVAPRMEAGAERIEPFQGALRWLIIFQAASVVPFVVWADPIVDLLLGDGYEESAGVLRALAPFIFLQGIAPLVSLSVNYMGEARRRVPIAIGTVLLNLGIDLALIPGLGVVGGAIGTDVAYMLYVPAHLWLCWRMVSLPMRPILATFGRSLVAALAMAGVLAAFGLGDVALPLLVLGGLAGGVVFILVLIATGETSVAELRALADRARRELFGARA